MKLLPWCTLRVTTGGVQHAASISKETKIVSAFSYHSADKPVKLQERWQILPKGVAVIAVAHATVVNVQCLQQAQAGKALWYRPAAPCMMLLCHK